MDELNLAFKKLKSHYRAVNPIKLDPEALYYKLEIEKKTLSPMAENLLDKVIDHCEEINEMTAIDLDIFEKFIQNYKDQYVFVGQLDQLYQTLDKSSRLLLIGYLAEELSIEVNEQTQQAEPAWSLFYFL